MVNEFLTTVCDFGVMENPDAAIAQFNARAKAGGWLQFCDPANAFVLRDCDTLVALWDWARGDRALPARDDLPVRVLKPYLPRLLMVECLQKTPPLMKFRLVGTIVTQTLTERTGQSFDHESATAEQTERWTQSALLSLAICKPLRFPIGTARAILGETLSLPLADDNGEPRFVLVYGRYEPTRDWNARERTVS